MSTSSSLLSSSYLPSTSGLSSSNARALPFCTRRSLVPRASTSDDRSSSEGGPNAVLDKATKKEISREDVLRNQEQNESEKRPFFGATPAKGSLYPYPRPEVERRPETGDKSFGSLMAFDGAGPETINGRLAMVGIVWAFLAERATGLTVGQQLFASGGAGLFNFLAVVQLIWYASLVPMFRGESPDSRQLGPFRAMAERWNGRTAMLGFLALSSASCGGGAFPSPSSPFLFPLYALALHLHLKGKGKAEQLTSLNLPAPAGSELF